MAGRVDFKRIIDELNDAVMREDFIDIAYGVVEKIEKEKDAFDAVELIFNVMEKNPDVDYGNPGPLVHFVESFYKKGYEDKLVESINRRPTPHTVWMLNRIINGSTEEMRTCYISLLENVKKRSDVSDEVKQMAKQFLEFQEE